MTDTQLDAVVIGGGPAGLQAALTLGRMRRSAVLLDSGSYRNAPAAHMQNLLGRDGADPAQLRADGRAELARYATVAVREAAATSVDLDGDGFVVRLGDEALRARRVLLATGVTDALPAIPGVAELFGDRVIHCPYCHGFEIADGPIAILGAAAHVPLQAALIGRLATEVLVLPNGEALAPETAAQLEALGARVVPGALREVRRAGEGIEAVLADGTALPLSGMLVHTAWRQAAPFAAQLGLELAPSGAVVVDALGRTSVAGGLAAGDLAQTAGAPMPNAAVAAAIAAGLTAAATIDRELAAAEAGIALPF